MPGLNGITNTAHQGIKVEARAKAVSSPQKFFNMFINGLLKELEACDLGVRVGRETQV